MSIFSTFLTEPLYNGLVFLTSILPRPDVGLAVIFLTILVKIILFPLSKKSIEAQVKMRAIEGDINKVKEKYKDDRQKQATAMMAMYKEKGINPLSGFFLILIQLPIIFALYHIFIQSHFPEINTDILYSFTPIPEKVTTIFLGLIDISKRSIFLAFATGISQFFQAKYSIPSMKPKVEGEKRSFQDDFARSMNVQMRYVFPIIAFAISYSISGVVALYWTTSNIFAIVQEVVARRMIKKKEKQNQK